MSNQIFFDHMDELPFHEAAPLFKNGDLLFCRGRGMMSRLIQQATCSEVSHVAMLVEMPITDQWLVIESVESVGVRCVTLEEGYLSNYNGSGAAYPGELMVARHQFVQQACHFMPELFRKTFSLLGSHYDHHAILQIAARICMQEAGIHPNGTLKPDHDYICSELVYALFQALKIQLPLDQRGFISPANIAQDASVEPVCGLRTKAMNAPKTLIE